MKLRIKGNSIRLRLTKTEIKKIAEGMPVQEKLEFGGGSALTYRLVPSAETGAIRADYARDEIRVLLPMDSSKAWADSDEVSLKDLQPLGGGQELFLLIEKDFVCLKPRAHEVEDETDLFANPNEAHGSCG